MTWTPYIQATLMVSTSYPDVRTQQLLDTYHAQFAHLKRILEEES